jgi:uncharacterized RDD family membrane protein YckC
MSLADNDTDGFEEIAQPVTAWIMFCLCSIFTNVVMLNLLISIIGQSFDRINAQSTVAKFKEKADLIEDNCYLLMTPFNFINIFKKNGKQTNAKWLMILTDMSEQTLQESAVDTIKST